MDPDEPQPEANRDLWQDFSLENRRMELVFHKTVWRGDERYGLGIFHRAQV